MSTFSKAPASTCSEGSGPFFTLPNLDSIQSIYMACWLFNKEYKTQTQFVLKNAKKQYFK